jgi:site-specific DNA-methyltransferase (adenine-specific)
MSHYDNEREAELNEEEWPRLMKGDCLERMKEIESGSVDMILTDPPYELSKSKGGGMMGKGGRKFMQEVKEQGMINGIDTESFLNACLSLFDHKQKFCAVITCSTKQIIEYITWAENSGFQYGLGIWHKSNPAPLCNYKYLNDVEYWIYIKGKKSKILGNYHSKSLVYKSQINKKDKKLYGHATCKPVELMEKFITNHSTDQQVILDPFMGSGSTGVAAKNLNRKFIGIEMDEGYFNIAKKRIDEA